MKNLNIILAIFFLFGTIVTVNAQSCPTVNVPLANQYTSSNNNYSFSGSNKIVGYYKPGSSPVVLSGNITFQANDTLYIAPGVQFTPNKINNFKPGCVLINCGTVNFASGVELGGTIYNYGTMSGSGLILEPTFVISNFGSATINGATPLPVKLITFSGVATKEYNELNWTLVAENVADIKLEYANNGKSFSTLEVYNLNGNTNGEATYSYNHTSGRNTANYYRLKFTDIDGTVNYSNVVFLKSDAAAATVSMYPNPFQSALNVTVSLAAAQDVQVIMTDLSGRTISVNNIAGQAGNNNVTINGLQQLTPGMYIVNVISGNERTSYKVVKN